MRSVPYPNKTLPTGYSIFMSDHTRLTLVRFAAAAWFVSLYMPLVHAQDPNHSLDDNVHALIIEWRSTRPASTPQGVYPASPDEQKQRLLSSTDPVYPSLARKFQVSGQVVFRALIATDGSVKAVTPQKGHPLLIEAARQAVMAWRYRPTIVDGRAVEVSTTIEVSIPEPHGNR